MQAGGQRGGQARRPGCGVLKRLPPPKAPSILAAVAAPDGRPARHLALLSDYSTNPSLIKIIANVFLGMDAAIINSLERCLC